MSFLLSVSAELARVPAPQELICTAMARLRERLGATRVQLAEFDEAQNERRSTLTMVARFASTAVWTMVSSAFECATPGSAARGLRILIVDDNVDAADSIAMLLAMEGHETRSVNTARAALLAAPEFRPQVVLLDIGLPEMDGYEVARRLREQNGDHRLRLVAVTGYGQPSDRRRAPAAISAQPAHW